MDVNTDVKKKGPHFYNSLHVAPLVEISNISINGNFNDDCRVYGDITVEDKRGHTFSIYHRTEDDPQLLMVSDNNLLLTVEDDLDNAVIIPSEYVSLNVNLFAVPGHDKITLQGSITLDRTCEDDWSEEYKNVMVAEKNNWNAKVHYVIFPYAVTATVSVLFFSKDDDFDTFEEIVRSDDGKYESRDEEDVTDYEKNGCTDITKLYGVVTAVASGTVASGIGSGKDVPKTILFRKRIEDCVQVQSGKFIDLSRSVVAVPAYSSLQIEASFFYADADTDTESTIAKGMVEFRTTAARVYKKDIMGCNGRIRVQVVWGNAYYQLYRNNIPMDMWDPVDSNMVSDGADQLKRQRVMSEQQVVSKHPSSSTLADDSSMPEYRSSKTHFNCILPDPYDAEPLLELYSVVVCSKDGKPFKFYGRVVVTSGVSTETLLSIDKSDPLDCPKSGISVIVSGPRFESFSILDRTLGIIVEIYDADGDDVISRGLISTKSWFHHMNLIDSRRICSVIRGQKGFAAVNYSVFYEGVSASVGIRLSGKFIPGLIKGKIYARYGYYEDIYKDKFTSFIFLNDGKGVLIDDPNSPAVPLQKRFLSLPVFSFLIIEADLLISPVNGNSAEGITPLKGNVTFFKNEGYSQQIGKGDSYLDVSVKFIEW